MKAVGMDDGFRRGEREGVERAEVDGGHRWLAPPEGGRARELLLRRCERCSSRPEEQDCSQ